MSRQIYVNLAVDDLARSRRFFEALGFPVDPRFSNDQAISVVFSDSIRAMLLVKPFFASFTRKPLADAQASTEVLLCLSCDSRAEVDALVAKAVAAGGRAPMPVQDHGYMYAHGFEDPDGHQWELCWMDPAAMPPQA